jgi:hypothetical protein
MEAHSGHSGEKSLLITTIGLASLPYLWFIAEYGSPAPVTPAYRAVYQHIAMLFSTHPDLHTNGWVPGQHLGHARYTLDFAFCCSPTGTRCCV